jgi:hypothetical protein
LILEICSKCSQNADPKKLKKLFFFRLLLLLLLLLLPPPQFPRPRSES